MTTPEKPTLPSLETLREAGNHALRLLSTDDWLADQIGRERDPSYAQAAFALRSWLAAMERGVTVYAFDDEVAAEADYEGSESFRTFRSAGAYAYGPLPCSRLVPYLLIPMPKEAADAREGEEET